MEPNCFITFNRDVNSCYSYYNNSLRLKNPERTVYSKKRAAFNVKKNYIFNKLEIWA